MKTAIPILALLMVLAACAPKPFASPLTSPSAPPTPPPSPAVGEEITPIGAILADPVAYRGREVTVIAYYRGWDLLGEAGTGPPRTRSDIAVADATGADLAAVLVVDALPVDRRHNAKIDRTALAAWAERFLAGESVPPP